MADEGIRLQLYLARSGLGSRRACEKMIEAGRVSVNGALISRQGCRVGPSDVVSLDGDEVRPQTDLVHIALNKPAGWLCSSSDDRGRPLAIDLVRPAVSGRIYTVGRLDFMSSGLILLTNDGEFCRAVSHPGRRIEKEYLVETHDEIPSDLLEAFRDGMLVDGVRYQAERFVRLASDKIRLILLEGKNREIRKVLDSRGIRVKLIHRIRIGPVRLGLLEPGRHRPLEVHEVRLLME